MNPPDPELARALVRWQHAAGPYWPYVCAAPFVGDVGIATLDAAARTQARRARSHIPRTVWQSLVAHEPTAIFVDLPPAWTLPSTPLLNELGFYVVPIIQRWTASPATLRCELLVAHLVELGQEVARPRHARGVVFLLDGERAGLTKRPSPRLQSRRVFDNRYQYPICRFPPPHVLLDAGIATLQWIASANVADDLRPLLGRYAEAGLSQCCGIYNSAARTVRWLSREGPVVAQTADEASASPEVARTAAQRMREPRACAH